jgi:microcin C transport system substrate-binding protein
MMLHALALLILTSLAFTSHASEPTSAIAMHGSSPMNEDDFTHLPYTNPNATKGTTLTQCSIGTFDTLNDNTMKGKAAQGLHMFNDPLMRRVWSEPFGLYGVIAKNVILPDDRASITFNLNPNAIFHDGSRITTADVNFSFESLRDKGKPNTRNVYKLVDKVTIENDKTIRFDFGEGYNQETALILAMMPIYSKTYWSTRDFDKTTLDIPLGSGPYKIKSIDQGRKITYEKVTDYWAKNNPVHMGHYNFDHMTFDYYRDEQVALEAFKSGNCDVRREFNPAKWQINYDDNGDYTREELTHSRPEPARGFIINTRRAPLNDIKVRKALSLAFDFDWMNKTLFHGKAHRVDSIFSNTKLKSNFSFNNNNKREKLKTANELLDTSQWTIKDGKRFELSLILNNPAEEKIALAYARDLKRLGIILNIRVLDTSQFFGALNDYDYDLVSWRWVNSLSPGTEQNVYWGCDAANTKGSRNYSGICNPEIETTIVKLADAKTYDDLTAHAQTLDSMIMNAYLFIPHYYTGVDYVAHQPRIHHPKNQSLYGMVMETWWSEE